MSVYDKKTPCKGCTERQVEPVNCHSYCEAYRAFREKQEKIKEARKVENEKDMPWRKKRRIYQR